MSEPIDIELPACFYLGREYDLATKTVRDDRPPVMYDARDLLTHGVVVGMTGSGKTGLCLSILEEAAIDGISSIIIDVKGDLTNLLLQFPDLKPDDFKKWLNPEDARAKKLSIDEYANQLSERWKKGLEETGQTPRRIELLRESSDFLVYTPGSDAGLPLAILKNFAAPEPGLPREVIGQRIDAVVSALLGLTGISADPVQSREHVFIAQLLLHAWNKGEDLDLAQLIARIQIPPIRTIGAFDVDTFYPEKERLKLALALNNLLASPSFSTWIEGDPLDFSVLMTGPKPRQVIFYLAHLEDTQRMFFLTLLLSEVLTWTRKQTGSSSLRTIVYFDEIFGYIPPHPANPPTKAPLMTLMKQARAFGVGILLATQNPVDLDYKALSNAGTWMVGKLQTERDKARLIAGLEGVAAERGTLSDRNYLENVISALGNRVFLLHNVHQPKPILMQTRWALSFLRGPMTRDHVAELMAPIKEQRQKELADSSSNDMSRSRAEDRAFRRQLQQSNMPSVGVASHVPPGLPPGLNPIYLQAVPPVATPAGPDAAPPPKRSLIYQAGLFACAEVDFVDKKRGLQFRRSYRLIAEAPGVDPSVMWSTATPFSGQIADGPAANAQWSEVPDSLNAAKKIKSLQKTFVDFLLAGARMSFLESHSKLGLRSTEGESLASFQERCRQAAERERDAELKTAESQYLAKRQPLASIVPSPPEPKSASASLWDLPVLNLFRPGPSKIVLGPTSKADVKRVAQARQKLEKLDAEWLETQRTILNSWQEIGEQYAEVILSPRKSDVSVVQFGLAWAPHWRLSFSDGRSEIISALK